MLVKMSKGYQLTIPASIRNRFGLKPGTEVDVDVEGIKIVITPIEDVNIEDVFKRADKFKEHKLSPIDLEKIENGFY